MGTTPPIPEYADVTPDIPVDAPLSTPPTRVGEAAQPRLADRLSALVGQAASRQEDSISAERLVAAIAARVDAATAELRERIAVVEAGQTARMTALESLVGDRLKAIEAAVEAPSADPGLRAHVDEVGGAVVLRLDEVLAGLAQQVEESHAELVAHADQTRATLTGHAEAASREQPRPVPLSPASSTTPATNSRCSSRRPAASSPPR